jgi:hypothetical protein
MNDSVHLRSDGPQIYAAPIISLAVNLELLLASWRDRVHGLCRIMSCACGDEAGLLKLMQRRHQIPRHYPWIDTYYCFGGKESY